MSIILLRARVHVLLEVLEMRIQFRNAQRERKSLPSGRIKLEMVALVYLIYIDDTVFCNSPSSFFINLSRLFCSSFTLFSLSPYQSVGGVFQVERPCRHHKNLLSISPYYTNRSIVGGRSVGRNEALRDNNEYDK